MSTEQKYRELIPGEVIQPGDEWMDFQGNWHRGMTNSMGENYRPEPDSSGRGNVYHCRHRRPLTDWEALYRKQVEATDEWKGVRNKLLAELAEMTKDRDEWKEVHTLAERAIQRLKSERDEFAKRLEDALSDKVIAEKSYNEAMIERDKAVKEVAHLKDVIADANKNCRLIGAEKLSLNVQISLARDMLNGQERRHKEEIDRLRGEIAKLNADYLKVMVERDASRKSEQEIGTAYLRIRQMMHSWDTVPGGEDRFAVTEKAIRDLIIERDQLARWKQEALIVQDWWHEVDQFVRVHHSLKIGTTIAHEALRMLREWDELKASIGVVESWMPKPPQNLREDIIRAINCRNAESGSDTPDWILGNFLMASLEAFDAAVKDRTQYYGEHGPIPTNPPIG